MELSDRELLTCYLDGKEPSAGEAFAELVRRNIRWMYSSALRQVGDTAAAEDVVQTSLVVLATNAAKIRQRDRLAGWLANVVRLSSCEARRRLARQRKHETEAAMRHSEPRHLDPTQQAAWNEIAPLLDECVAKLNQTDREAILLRYYRGQSYEEVGQALKMSADTARKRTDRALEKLRGMITAKSPAILSAGVLAMMLETQSASASVPAGLIASATTAAMSGSASAILTSNQYHLLMGVNHIMTIAKLKVVAGIAALGLVVTVSGVKLLQHALAQAPESSPASQPHADPRAQLPGKWKFVTIVTQGKTSDPQSPEIKEAMIEINETAITIHAVEGLAARTFPYVLNTDVFPQQIDLTFPQTVPSDDKLISKGIFNLTGDELTICFSGEFGARPVDFYSAKWGPNQVLWGLKRWDGGSKPAEPATQPAPVDPRRMTTMQNMKQMVLAMFLYSYQNMDMLPSDIQSVRQLIRNGDPATFESPFGKDGYVYIGNARTPVSALEHPAETIILYDKAAMTDKGTVAAFADGHIEWLSSERFNALLEQSRLQFEDAKQ